MDEKSKTTLEPRVDVMGGVSDGKRSTEGLVIETQDG